MELADHYDDLAALWRWAARAYAERAAKGDIGVDDRRFAVWNDAAVRASQRASAYARLAVKAASIPAVGIPREQSAPKLAGAIAARS